MLILSLLAACGAPADPPDTLVAEPTDPVAAAALLGDLPPPAAPRLQADNFVAGGWATLLVSGVPAGAEVRLLLSRSGLGDGPCHALLGGGCVGMLGPIQRVNFSAIAGADGSAGVRLLVPRAAGGRYLSLQGYVVDSGALTNPVGRPVAAPGTIVGGDQDGDGFTPAEGDCADFLAGYGPEAADATRDARDQNCDDADGDDGDGDGYVDARSGGDDCDDDDASAWPGAPELCDDAGADEDCDGTPDDGCFEGADCQDILMNDPAATSRAYHLDPDGPGGAAPFDAWCDMTTDGGGWTKVAYFTGSRATTTGAVTASTLATSLAGTGKLSDAQINTLMGNHHEMLAAQAANPARWVRVTWGDTWTWDESRVSGALGDHCQDLPYGGWLQRWDGTTTFASYRMSTPGLRSSYCWRFSWNEGGEGGIDLQDDGDGASNASTTGVAQSPFVMFVRRGDPTCDVHADCPVGAPICDAGVCAPAQDCEELHDLRPGLATGTYGVDPLGSGAPTPAWCDMTTDGGGWTKILYFSSTRALTTGAVAAQGLSGSLIEEGKLSDAMINALMGADHKMLAVYPANPARWLVATWGTAWTFKDDRPSGQAGGFCQTVAGGGGLRLWDGSSRTANYTDAANLRSSYCYNTDTGFDLQNDGTGQSNAALPGVSQQPFVMFVRR